MAGADVVRTMRRLVEPLYAQATDRELLGRYLAERDEAAFETLTRRHARLVRVAVGGVLTDPNDIDDALQATFLILVRRARGTDWKDTFGPWLYGVAHRVAVKLRAHTQRRPGQLGETDVAASPPRIDEGWREACDLLHAELDRLPDRYRLPLLLCYLEGQTRDEAAAALGWTVGTVKGRVRRGCDLLRRRLTQRGVSLSAGLLAAVATPRVGGGVEASAAAVLRGACSPRALTLAREVTMKSIVGMVAAGVVAVGVLIGLGTSIIASAGGQREPPVEKAVAEPIPAPSAQPLALQYVPVDAAVFFHVDAQRLWGGPIGAGAREAEPKLLTALAEKIQGYAGTTVEKIESLTVFVASFEKQQLGIVVAYRSPVDKDRVKAALATLAPNEQQQLIQVVNDRLGILTLGFDAKSVKPRAADAKGPLSAALQEAATGRHMLVVGATGANLPDEFQGDRLPAVLRPFKAVFDAETASMFVTQGKELAFELRVRANTPAKAGEAEKVLGLLVTILRESLEGMASTPSTGSDPLSKSLDKLVKGALPGVKAATFSTEGAETRAKLAIPSDLPVGAVFVPSILKVREAAARSQSANNLKQIGLAMHNYHATHESFPPAAVVDKAGKPMLSWRVLILPFIEYEALYKEFHLDEPWDSEHNKKLIAKMPKTYALPDATATKPGETHYRVFVGNGAAFDPVRGVKLTEFTDGTSDTILAVTAAESVPWTKPDELTYDPAKDPRKLLWVGPSNGTNVLFGDGSVRFLSNQISAKLLHRLITRAEGVPAKDD